MDELRPLVAATPEGSVARELLALIDESIEKQRARDRQRIVDMVRCQGRTPEEAEALVAACEAGGEVEMETVKCWTCDGFGFVSSPGGMGSHGDDGNCPTCHGDRTASRFKMPEPKEPA